MLVPDVGDEYSAALIGGIESCLSKKGFFYFVVSHRGAPDLLRMSPDTLLDRGVEGMIFINTPLNRALPVPIVAICDITEGPGITRIKIDNGKAATLTIQHLLKLGHRVVIYLGADQAQFRIEAGRALPAETQQIRVQNLGPDAFAGSGRSLVRLGEPQRGEQDDRRLPDTASFGGVPSFLVKV